MLLHLARFGACTLRFSNYKSGGLFNEEKGPWEGG